MGLDSIELVMEWEKAFDIQIPDADAGQISSVKDATDTILRLIQLKPTPECKTQMLFNQFRQYFETNLGIAKHSFQLTNKLSELLPLENRKEIWQKMEQSLGWRLPQLTGEDLDPNFHPIKEVKFLGITWIKSPLETPLANHTIGDLIDFTFSLNYEKLVALPVIASRFEVEKVVMGITSEKLGIAIQEIKTESTFTTDLGID